MSRLELHGPVDPHVHLRDLDWSHKATFGLAMDEGRLDAERSRDLVTTGPQRVLGIGPLPDTNPLVDLDASWVVDGRQLLTAPAWSPFDGMRVWGRVREVRIRGAVADDRERVTTSEGSGRDVLPC